MAYAVWLRRQAAGEVAQIENQALYLTLALLF